MATEEPQNNTVFPQDDMDEFEDETDDEEEDIISTSSAVAVDPSSVSVAVPPPQITPITPPELKRQRIESSSTQSTMMITPVAVHEQKKLQQPLDEARKLFQRLWTDEDEIELLQGFYEYTTQRGTNNINHHHHHNDTTLFYDQIKSKLQLEFNKNQLVEKLRRLKKKYRTVVAKISSGKEFVFKIPHDHATFVISRKIWGELGTTAVGAAGTVGLDGGFDEEDANANSNHKTSNINVNNTGSVNNHCNNEMIDLNDTEKKVNSSKKRPISLVKVEEKTIVNDKSVATPVSSSIHVMIEEAVKSCLSPLLKELTSNATNGGAKGLLSPIPLNFGGSSSVGNLLGGDIANEKWRKQQILELEVYSKRLDLVQDQIKATLEELRSAGSS